MLVLRSRAGRSLAGRLLRSGERPWALGAGVETGTTEVWLSTISQTPRAFLEDKGRVAKRRGIHAIHLSCVAPLVRAPGHIPYHLGIAVAALQAIGLRPGALCLICAAGNWPSPVAEAPTTRSPQ